MLHHNHWNRMENTTVITGLGRSGTTFLALVFYNAGYNMGPANPKEIGTNIPDGGMEVHHIKMVMKHGLPPNPYPRITKDPTFARNLPTWIALGQKPKDAILLARDMQAATNSHLSHNHPTNINQTHRLWYTGLRNLITHGIPVTIIPYPEIGTDPNLSVLLEPWIPDPWPIIQRTFDITKVHHDGKSNTS